MYPETLVNPMRAELSDHGFEELFFDYEVDKALSQKGTTLLMVNSVCGCAARSARPGVIQSLKNNKKPKNLYTVFAGVDTEATARTREYMIPYPPSSPSVALFKDGDLLHVWERHHLEGRPAEVIAEDMVKMFEKYCG
jgi:putative YphP/YqiW family bacilliredoxin